jgi:hypothetical protein
MIKEPVGTSHSCQRHTHAPLGRRAIIVAPREAELSSRQVVRYLQSLPKRRLAMELILIVVVLVLLFGGGGYYGRRRGHW